MPINLLAVFAAAVAAFVLGFLFHGPIAGKLWMRLADIHPTGNEKLSDMVPQMLWNLLANLLTAFVMAMFFWVIFASPIMGQATWYRGAILGIWFWAGFLITSTSMDVIWMGRSVKLWLFESTCSFVVMAVMGVILAVW